MTQHKQLTVAPTRLPYHPLLKERYDVDEASWRALVDAVWPSAKTAEGVMLALSYCHARQMDPFKRVVHIVPVWDNEQRRYVEGVWPGIASHRIEASRTKDYAGADPTSFGESIERTFWHRPKKGEDKEITVHYPEWAQMTVYRMIQGQRCAFPGPRCYFDGFYARESRASDCPNERWRTSPSYMLEKCAEAAALRKAFPEALGGELTAEEVEGRHDEMMKDVTPPKPQRDYVSRPLTSVERAHLNDVLKDPEIARRFEQEALEEHAEIKAARRQQEVEQNAHMAEIMGGEENGREPSASVTTDPPPATTYDEETGEVQELGEAKAQK